MKCTPTPLEGAYVLEPTVHGDERGFFLEFYNQRAFAEAGITTTFVQDNQSRSGRGVLRGLHYQIHQPQSKLIRVVQGAILDVIVDIRRDRPTFGHHFSIELSAASKTMLFVPKGLAHGFYTLTDVVDIEYKCDNFYAPVHERGIRWDDPDLGIAWPLPEGETPLLSERDQALPYLRTVAPTDLF